TLLDDLLNMNLGTNYMRAERLDSALYYLGSLRKKIARTDTIYRVLEMHWSLLQSRLGNLAAALEASDNAVQIDVTDEIHARIAAEVYFSRSELFEKLNNPDSSICYAQQAVAIAEKIGHAKVALQADTLLAHHFESKDLKQAIYYH